MTLDADEVQDIIKFGAPFFFTALDLGSSEKSMHGKFLVKLVAYSESI